jgi:predicted nucleic acid-binding protein
MILIDTSVWINHLRKGNSRLTSLLSDAEVLCHPFVIGEIACGFLRDRQEILRHLAQLPVARVATDQEVLAFIESHRLYGRGLGWVDVHVLASARLTGVELWTLDTPLAAAARRLHLLSDD